jgi:hypothetical protein
MVRKVYTARNGARYIKLANGQCRFVSGGRRQRGGAEPRITYEAHLYVNKGAGLGEIGTDGALALMDGNILNSLKTQAVNYGVENLNVEGEAVRGRDDYAKVTMVVNPVIDAFTFEVDGDGLFADQTMADIVADVNNNMTNGYWINTFKVKRVGGDWLIAGHKERKENIGWNIFIDNLPEL